MANKLLLSQGYIRDMSIINSNVDFALLRPLIFMIQDLKLKPILGNNLYKQILSQSPSSFSPANQILVDDYILPMLHWYLVAESAITLKFRLVNAGVMENSGEYMSAASTDDLDIIARNYTSIAQNYAEDTRKYIMANQADFPEYFTNNEYDQTQPAKSGFTELPFFIPGYGSQRIDGQRDDLDKINNPSWPD